jgi:4-hydroxybenzoate polyprenyltransferase
MVGSRVKIRGRRRGWSTSAAQLGRTSLLGVTFILVLLGAAAAERRVSSELLLLTLLAATAFHVAVYVANDIVDLPIDRTEPRRAASPLVRGTVTVRQMTLVVAVAGVTALAFAAVASARAIAPMALSLVMLLAYDVWGKRCRLPPFTDLVQGVGWAALVWYGSEAVGRATRNTLWLGVYVTLAIVVVNGVHGAVRDLANDSAHGARTTARWLGGRVDASGTTSIPTRLWVYAVVLHLADVSVLIAALATEARRRPALIAVVALGGGACLAALCLGLVHAGRRRVSWGAGFAYIIVMLVLPATLVVDHLRGTLLAVTVVLFVVPWACSTYVRTTLRAAARRRVTVGP